MTEINKKVKALSKMIDRMENLDLSLYGPEGQYNYLMKIVTMAEDLAVTARKLPGSYREIEEYPFVRADIEERIPIQFSTLKNGIEKITFERLLPLRRQASSVRHYFFNLYYPYIKKKYADQDRPDDTPMTFCYVYYYDNERNFRDYDNVETKVIQDMVSPFFIPDDSPKYLSRYDMCLCGEPRMELYIMPENKFLDFYQSIKLNGENNANKTII